MSFKLKNARLLHGIRRATVFVYLFVCTAPVVAQHTEADYCDLIHAKIGGEREYRVYGGRVDIVTDTHAYEVEWANKWKNAIGQALWYALQTNRKPGIILILKEPKDYTYFQQLNSALEYAELADKIDVTLYPTDYE